MSLEGEKDDVSRNLNVGILTRKKKKSEKFKFLLIAGRNSGFGR